MLTGCSRKPCLQSEALGLLPIHIFMGYGRAGGPKMIHLVWQEHYSHDRYTVFSGEDPLHCPISPVAVITAVALHEVIFTLKSRLQLISDLA